MLGIITLNQIFQFNDSGSWLLLNILFSISINQTLTTVTIIMFSFKPPQLLLLINNENEGGYVTLSSRAGHLAPTSYHPSPTQFVLLCVFSNIHAMDPEKQTFSTNCSFFIESLFGEGLCNFFDQTFSLTSLQPITGQEPGLDCFEANQRGTPTCWVSLSFCSFGHIIKCTSTENQMQIYFHFQTSSISLDHLENAVKHKAMCCARQSPSDRRRCRGRTAALS